MKAIYRAMTVLGAVVLGMASISPSLANTPATGSEPPTDAATPAPAQPPPATTAREIYNLGITKANQGDLQGAIEAFDRAIFENPRFVLAYVARGTAQLYSGNTQTAKASFDQAIRINRNYSIAYYRRSSSRYRLRDIKGAVADLNQAIRINRNWGSSDLIEALVVRGELLLDLKNSRAALADFNRAVRLNSRSSLAYASRGLALMRLGKKKPALADLNRAIQLNQDWRFLNLASAYGTRGMIRRSIGDEKGAVADLRIAADLYQKQQNERAYLSFMSQIQGFDDIRPQVPINLGCYVVLPDRQVRNIGKICAASPEPTKPPS